jgi:hypothetical protein
MQVDDFLRTHGAQRGVRGDWEVRTGPQGVTVIATTADRFTRPEQASQVAVRILHDIVALGYRVDGPCEIDAQRDLDGDWRGGIAVHLQPASAPVSEPEPTADYVA